MGHVAGRKRTRVLHWVFHGDFTIPGPQKHVPRTKSTDLPSSEDGRERLRDNARGSGPQAELTQRVHASGLD